MQWDLTFVRSERYQDFFTPNCSQHSALHVLFPTVKHTGVICPQGEKFRRLFKKDFVSLYVLYICHGRTLQSQAG